VRPGSKPGTGGKGPLTRTEAAAPGACMPRQASRLQVALPVAGCRFLRVRVPGRRRVSRTGHVQVGPRLRSRGPGATPADACSRARRNRVARLDDSDHRMMWPGLGLAGARRRRRAAASEAEAPRPRPSAVTSSSHRGSSPAHPSPSPGEPETVPAARPWLPGPASPPPSRRSRNMQSDSP
jgi:hypothetical protein